MCIRDRLKYLFLKKHKRVADGLNNVTSSTDYVIINKDSEAKEVNKINKIKRFVTHFIAIANAAVRCKFTAVPAGCPVGRNCPDG